MMKKGTISMEWFWGFIGMRKVPEKPFSGKTVIRMGSQLTKKLPSYDT